MVPAPETPGLVGGGQYYSITNIEKALGEKVLFCINNDSEKEVEYYFDAYFKHKMFMRSIGRIPDEVFNQIVNKTYGLYTGMKCRMREKEE